MLVLNLQATQDGSFTFFYAFGSEEYNEYVGSQYNDVFRLLVNDVDVALIPGSGDVVAINNVNLDRNADFFTDNTGTGIGTA